MKILPNLPNEIINIIMSYVMKNNIYRQLIETKENIDYMNVFYNHSISFSRYFLFKRELYERNIKKIK